MTPLRIRPGASTRRAKAIRIGYGGSPERAAGWVVETGPDRLALLGQRPVRGTSGERCAGHGMGRGLR